MITGLPHKIPDSPGIAASFNIEPRNATLIGTAFGVAYAAGFLLLGPLSDRYGRKRMVLIGLVVTAVSTALVGIASSFGLLLACRAAQGLAASIFPPVASRSSRRNCRQPNARSACR